MIQPEKIFDLAAKNYDRTEEKRFQQFTFMTVDKTKKYLRETDILLDYGCATGTKALEFAGVVKKIQGIDISSKMVEAAKRKACERTILNADFVQTTIFDARFKNESFDVVTAFNILHLMENGRQVVERIVELLKPGGLFISTTPCLGEKMKTLTKFQFSFFILLNKFGWFPSVKRFKFSDLEALTAHRNLQVVEMEKTYDRELSNYFLVAKKI